MVAPKKFLRETDHYWVIGEEPSDSSDDVYEIRTSKRDGRTYCSCPFWYRTLQPRWSGAQGICKHLRRFMDKQATKTLAYPDEVEQVTVYDLDSWAVAKRTMTTEKAGKLGAVKVRRPGC